MEAGSECAQAGLGQSCHTALEICPQQASLSCIFLKKYQQQRERAVLGGLWKTLTKDLGSKDGAKGGLEPNAALGEETDITAA